MYDDSASGMAYNRLTYLDGIEDRIAHYLLYYYDHEPNDEKYLVTRIRRILLYNDVNALFPATWETDDDGNVLMPPSLVSGYPDPISVASGAVNITDPTKSDFYAGLALVPIDQELTQYPGTEKVITIDDRETEITYIWALADEAIDNLIYKDADYATQTKKRVFFSPRLGDAFDVQCSMLKIYVDSIIPTDHLKAVTNVGVDVVVNNKIINLQTPDDEANNYVYTKHTEAGYPYDVTVSVKSRVTTLTQAVIALLNGAAVQGVGKMIFSRNMSIYNQAQYGLWNNRDFEGMKLVIGVYMSGVN